MLGDVGDKLVRDEKAEDRLHIRLPAIDVDEFEASEALQPMPDRVSYAGSELSCDPLLCKSSAGWLLAR